MRHDISTSVLWQELKEIANIKNNYLAQNPEISKLKLGNSLYIDKETIKDPLIRLEAESCTNLQCLYPISILVNEFNLDIKTREYLYTSSHCVYVCGVAMFVVPEEILGRQTTNRKQIINIIEEGESEDGYDTVVKITTKFKLGSYIP